MSTRLAALAVGWLSLVVVGTGAAPRVSHGDWLGLQPGFGSDPKAYDGVVARCHAVGVGWVRIYWNWAWVEGSQGHRYLAPVTAAVTAAHRRGMKIIVLATGAPAWANGGKPQDDPPTDAHVADFAAYAAALAADCGADAVEVWNEPNNPGFWRPGPDPVRLARLQMAAYRAVKAARPGTTVVTGGLTQVTAGPRAFFEETVAADPAVVRCFDAVGLHPYNEPTDPLLPGTSGLANVMTVQAPAIHRLLAARGRADVPIWFTEYGVATHGRWSVTEAAQATYLSHFFDGVAALRRDGVPVGVCVLYTLQDGAAYGGTDDQPFFGLLRHDGSEKPAAATVRAYARSAD